MTYANIPKAHIIGLGFGGVHALYILSPFLSLSFSGSLLLRSLLSRRVDLNGAQFVAQHFSNHYPSFVLSLIIIHSSPPNEDLAECFRPYSRVKYSICSHIF